MGAASFVTVLLLTTLSLAAGCAEERCPAVFECAEGDADADADADAGADAGTDSGADAAGDAGATP